MLDLEKIEKVIKIDCNKDNFVSKRIDLFLLEQFQDQSRAYFQKLIKEKLVYLNNKICDKSSYKLKKTDILEIRFPAIKQFDLSPQKIDNLEILDIQQDFVIINKPAGLIVHPSEKTQQDQVTLINGLLYHFEELNKFSNKERPGIVHRIDKGTSGLLLIARNPQSLMKFSAMFKKREIKKTYLAVVKGHPPKNGKIDFSIGRHPYKRHLMSHASYVGRPALSYYSVLAYYKDCSLVKVRIITGRTHQIRVHMSAIGHGIVGDDSYGYKSKYIDRPALHAWKIAFEFKGEKFKYYKSVPQDFKNLIFLSKTTKMF